MKSFLYLSMLLQLLFYLHAVVAGPLMISNGDDIVEDVEIDDEFTTQTVERLSSAATCLVASVEYTHGQQIYRADPCEFCLCLDGEMFCWWQDCPPALEGPCKDKRPFTSCPSESENVIDSDPQSHSPSAAQTRREAPDSDTITSTTNSTTIATSSATSASKIATISSSASNSRTIIDGTNEYNNSNAGQEAMSSVAVVASLLSVDVTTDTPKRCSIMGRLYNIGDRLPHTTGNCVECICGAGAQIVCSPHQCAPSVDDINEYRPAGLRSGQPDVF